MLSNGLGALRVICTMWKLKYGYGWGSISNFNRKENENRDLGKSLKYGTRRRCHWDESCGSKKVSKSPSGSAGCGIRSSRLKDWKSCGLNLLLWGNPVTGGVCWWWKRSECSRCERAELVMKDRRLAGVDQSWCIWRMRIGELATEDDSEIDPTLKMCA